MFKHVSKNKTKSDISVANKGFSVYSERVNLTFIFNSSSLCVYLFFLFVCIYNQPKLRFFLQSPRVVKIGKLIVPNLFNLSHIFLCNYNLGSSNFNNLIIAGSTYRRWSTVSRSQSLLQFFWLQ